MRRPLLAVATVLALATGCGGGQEDDVRDAIGRFASATETEDARTACSSVTPDTRMLLGRLAEARLGRDGCEALLESRFAVAGGRGFAIDPDRLAAVEDADVDIDGDRALVDTFGDKSDLPLARSAGQWRLDLAALPAEGYSIRASVACTENDAAWLRAPLPRPTRAGYAATTRRLADRLDALAGRLEGLRPPSGSQAAHRDLLAAMRAQARELRAVARGVAGDGPVLEAVSRRGAVLRELEARTLAAQRKLGVTCDATAFRGGAEGFRKDAERVCRAVSRRVRALEEPAGPQELGAYMRRVRAAGATASRGLRRLEPPDGLARAHERAVDAYDASLDAIPPIARAGDPTAAYEAYSLRSLRASTAFSRLGLPTCASL